MNVRNPGKGRGCGGYSEETRLIMRNNNLGKKLSEETKQKLSKAHKGKTISKETREKLKISNSGKEINHIHINNLAKINSKPVIQMDLEGNFIKEWPSITSASQSFNTMSYSNITEVCKGIRKTAYKFKWKFKN